MFLSGLTVANPEGDYHHMGWEFGMFGGFGILLFWSVLILFIVLAIRSARSGFKKDNHASKILDERYARGEIDEEEYTKRKRVLNDLKSD